jgi:hypothetical protein
MILLPSGGESFTCIQKKGFPNTQQFVAPQYKINTDANIISNCKDSSKCHQCQKKQQSEGKKE